jgi:hypothetical protein
MIFEVLRDSDRELCFATAPRARRGRGVLYALAPWVIFLLGLSILFSLALGNLIPLEWAKVTAVLGAGAAAVLSPIAYVLGYRARDQVETTAECIRIQRTPSLGSPRSTLVATAEIAGFSIDPSIRSLGADLRLVAVHRDGRRITLAEGEPHRDQLRQFASRAAQLTGLPLEAPRFAQPAARSLGPSERSQPKQ